MLAAGDAALLVQRPGLPHLQLLGWPAFRQAVSCCWRRQSPGEPRGSRWP
jgi:hypothetical protein